MEGNEAALICFDFEMETIQTNRIVRHSVYAALIAKESLNASPFRFVELLAGNWFLDIFVLFCLVFFWKEKRQIFC